MNLPWNIGSKAIKNGYDLLKNGAVALSGSAEKLTEANSTHSEQADNAEAQHIVDDLEKAASKKESFINRNHEGDGRNRAKARLKLEPGISALAQEYKSIAKLNLRAHEDRMVYMLSIKRMADSHTQDSTDAQDQLDDLVRTIKFWDEEEKRDHRIDINSLGHQAILDFTKGFHDGLNLLTLVGWKSKGN